MNVAEVTGIRAVLVHAISDDARSFYERAGFTRSPIDPMVVMATVADIQKALRRA